MRKLSERMPSQDYIMQRVLTKEFEVGKLRLILICKAAGYTEKEVKEAIKELRRTGQIYCCRREEFFKVT